MENSIENLKSTFGLRFVQTNIDYSQSEIDDMCNLAYNAFDTLALILDIPKESIGLSKKIAISLGSSTMPSSMTGAFYSPKTKMIAFRDKKRFSHIAHEWFHAFDHYAAYTYTSKGMMPYSDERGNWNGSIDIKNAFINLIECVNNSDYYNRSKLVAVSEGNNYWIRPCELLARAFEAYIKLKLEQNDIQNEALVSDFHGLLPNFNMPNDKPIISAFDNLFALFKENAKHKRAKALMLKMKMTKAMMNY